MTISGQKKALDAGLLRKALRLVHCIQKERGASCCYFASHNDHNQLTRPHFETAMLQARSASNVAVQLLTEHVQTKKHNDIVHHKSPTVPILNNLTKIRTFIDDETRKLQQEQLKQKETPESPLPTTNQSHEHRKEDELAFHRIFVCFNTLVSFVAYEYVLKQTQSSSSSNRSSPPSNLRNSHRKLLDLIDGDDNVSPTTIKTTISSSTPPISPSTALTFQKGRHRRALSSDINDKLSKGWKMSPRVTPSSSRNKLDRIESGELQEDNHHRKPTLPPTVPFLIPPRPPTSGDTSAQHAGARTATLEEQAAFKLIRRASFSTEEEMNDAVFVKDISSSSPPPPPPPPPLEEQRRLLMDLLNCFVQLKESTGVERCVLSSLLAFKNAASADVASPGQQLLSDLAFFGEGTREGGSGIDGATKPASFQTRSSPISSSSSSRLLSDLIVEVENQRRLIAKLHDLPNKKSGPLGMSNLVLELAELSPSLLELQTKILTNPGEFLHHGTEEDPSKNEHADSDNGTSSYDSETIFQVITIYMDKLHSLELLIIEELEACWQQSPLPLADGVTSTEEPVARIPSPGALSTRVVETTGERENKSRPAVTSSMESDASGTTLVSLGLALQQHVLAGMNGNHDGNGTGSARTVLMQIEALSSERCKDLIMTALRQEMNNRAPTTTSPDGSVSPQTTSPHQSLGSTADSLNDKINTALAQVGTPKGSSQPRNAKVLDRHSSKEWEINIYEIKFQRRIGQGASGTTYRATWSGQNVAVKVASITNFGLEGWRTEVAALQKLHHPNVIRLLGSVYHANPLTFCLVLEYCNAGDLATALKYPTPRNFFFHVSIPLANAMAYLHSRHVIHRDLKPANILCDGNIASGNFTIKVTDFGVATQDDVEPEINPAQSDGNDPQQKQDPKKKHLTGETGTYRWMAPEVIRHEAYSGMADVYSFAVIVWQLLTREDPFHTESDSAAVAIRVATEQHARPPFPEQTPSPIKQLIEACWSDDPCKRWKFDRTSETLQNIQKSELSPEEKTWIEDSDGHAVYFKPDPSLSGARVDKAGGAAGGRKGAKGGAKGSGAHHRHGPFWSLFGGNKHHKGKNG